MTNCVAKAMQSSEQAGEAGSLAPLASTAAEWPHILDILSGISEAPSADAVMTLLRDALGVIGADSGAFMSVIKDDTIRTSYRSLLACNPIWATECARHGWHEHSPWLRHALQSSEPALGSELVLRPEDQTFISTAAKLGFASAIIAPAPSNAGSSRLGVLCVGSHQIGFFETKRSSRLRVITKALAMEMHTWLVRAVGHDLLVHARLTPEELALLRHEAAGHTSKMIGAELNVEAKTIDCRFQRLSAKLGTPDRRTAARIARLYGLL